jgi:hypothetical protein
MFTIFVQKQIQTKSLWKHNTVVNRFGPQAGDLMMRYTTSFGVTDKHHTALVFQTFPPGAIHPRWNDKSVPDFPGSDSAKWQLTVTEYFRGTVDEAGATTYRAIDLDTHFDYLNHRGEAKPLAELIYYANARQIQDDGFEFRMYAPHVLDNWLDWDGQGTPPR